jgi:hypothetical protein
MVQKLWGFEDFSPSLGMLSSTVNAAKFAQNCPKHPKFAKIYPKTKIWNTTKNRDFSVFWNWKFLRVKALEHVSAIRIFNPRIFHMLFWLSKIGLCMWISAYPLMEIDDFLKVPHLMWTWDFVDMYLTHLGIRIRRGSFHIYLRKWIFGPQKIVVPLWQGQKNFFFNFECYDLANGKEWECHIW